MGRTNKKLLSAPGGVLARGMLLLAAVLFAVACDSGGTTKDAGGGGTGATGAGGTGAGGTGATGDGGTGVGGGGDAGVGVGGNGGLGAGGDGGAVVPGREAVFSVKHYEYEFDITTNAAVSTLTLEVTRAGSCVALPYRPEQVGAVLLNGAAPGSATVEAGSLTVCAPEGGQVAAGAAQLRTELTVPIGTWAPTQVGLSTTPDRNQQPFTYLVSWVGGCDRFGPCDSSPSAFATYRFHVRHPAGTRVLCPGNVTPGATETTCDFPHAGGPTYSTFGLMASPGWTEVDLGTWGDVKVKLYDLPGSNATTLFRGELGTAAAGFLDFMERTFGAYPFGDELRFVIAPTYWGGFEHPGNIVLRDAASVPNSFRHTVLHEIAHQWAGDETTLAQTADFVWKESMAEYLSYLYEFDAIGEEVALATAKRWFSNAGSSPFYPVPSEQPPLVDYYGHVYALGPLVLFRQTEALFGRDKVVEALQLVLGEQRALSVRELQAAFEQTTGAELQAYFDNWVFGTGRPVKPAVKVTYEKTGQNVLVTGTLDRVDGAARGFAITVQLRGPNSQTDRLDVRLDFGADAKPVATALVTPSFEVKSFVFNPYAEAFVSEKR